MTETDIAFTRPTRSAIIDQGMTPTARPIVQADTMSAALAAPTPRSAEICGRTPCGE
jgi:hypothetical protein